MMTQVTKDKLEVAKRYHAEGLSIEEACRKAGLPKATYAYHVYGPYGRSRKGAGKAVKKGFTGAARAEGTVDSIRPPRW